MLDAILQALKGLPKEWVTLIISALPVSELRGGIPVALMMGLSPAKAFWLSILGNCAIIVPTLLLLEPISNALMRFEPWKKFFEWLFARTRAKSDIIQRYEALGLILFVAIPLPMTGAWTGCIAASLFRIKFRYAFPAIVAGVLIAGAVVLSVCLFGKGAFGLFLAR
ncbi:MAG: small multi-drug export protein [Candidatus Omnitrophica bacterium]|nr:small multi-drug export protein [Candidatus Omnitrophota bacterium]